MPFNKQDLRKLGLYLIIAWILAVLQNIPGFLSIFGTKPMLAFAFAIVVAMHEKELYGAFFGACCGLLCDFFSYNRIGFNAFFLCLSCVLIGLIVQIWMRANYPNSVIFTFTALLVIQLLVFIFRIYIRGYDYSGLFLLYYSLPLCLYTAVWALPFFWLTGKIHQHFASLGSSAR